MLAHDRTHVLGKLTPLAWLCLLVSGACGGARPVLPSLPPPEYEEPGTAPVAPSVDAGSAPAAAPAPAASVSPVR
jgi:hypothetical protein